MQNIEQVMTNIEGKETHGQPRGDCPYREKAIREISRGE